MDRSRAAVESIYDKELLGLSAVRQAGASMAHIDRGLDDMALAWTLAERRELAGRLDGHRAALRAQLEAARPLFHSGGGHALFVAVEQSIRRYEEAIPEAIGRLAREEPGAGRDGIAYLVDEVRPLAHDAAEGLGELARHKALVAEQYKLAMSEHYRSSRALMLALCAASLGVGLGLDLLALRRPMRILAGEPAIVREAAARTLTSGGP